LDNGAFSCWHQPTNTFNDAKWAATEQDWLKLLFWSQVAPMKPRWSLVPDVPGNGERTLAVWDKYVSHVKLAGFPTALAVQDGMTPDQVRQLSPDVVFVGGTTEWKWETAEMWCREFPRVHVGRVNSPEKLYLLESWGAESCDGTGWNRGDRKQTAGLEEFCRARAEPTSERLWPHASRAALDRNQLTFA
jgi:hypothetical protein